MSCLSRRSVLGALAACWLAAGASPACAAPPADAIKPPVGGITYVDFWASWCAPCAEAFPWLNQMHAKYAAQGLRIVGVGVDSEARNADRFLRSHPAQFDIVRDPQGKFAEQYGVEGMPYAVLIDASGKVLHRHTGYRAGEAAAYEAAIREALATAGAVR